ncbi:hypothetical protein BDQ17DRAFT_1542806 [Cyathus striatus]|nr:hypothetical protein BDQ17DRAFT_1542806 [Cyathus striatus]
MRPFQNTARGRVIRSIRNKPNFHFGSLTYKHSAIPQKRHSCSKTTPVNIKTFNMSTPRSTSPASSSASDDQVSDFVDGYFSSSSEHSLVDTDEEEAMDFYGLYGDSYSRTASPYRDPTFFKDSDVLDDELSDEEEEDNTERQARRHSNSTIRGERLDTLHPAQSPKRNDHSTKPPIRPKMPPEGQKCERISEQKEKN